MGAIFQSLGRTVGAGAVLLVLLILVAGSGKYDHAWGTFAMRWAHVMCGVMWIGLLWYFNFVQIPSMPKIPDEQKPAIGKVIAPTALLISPDQLKTGAHLKLSLAQGLAELVARQVRRL